MRLLLEAVDYLPPTYRDVVRLRDLEGRAVADVARQLHVPQSNVAVRLHRAHKRLRRYLMRQLHLPERERARNARGPDSAKPRCEFRGWDEPAWGVCAWAQIALAPAPCEAGAPGPPRGSGAYAPNSSWSTSVSASGASEPTHACLMTPPWSAITSVGVAKNGEILPSDVNTTASGSTSRDSR